MGKKYYIQPVNSDFFDYKVYYGEDQAAEDHFFGYGNGYSFNDDKVKEVEKGLVDAYYNIFDKATTPASSGSSDYTDEADVKNQAECIIEILNYSFAKDSRKAFSNREVNTLLDCVELYETKNDDYDRQLVCKVLEIIYDEPFIYGTLSGASQGDWMYYMCPKSLEPMLSYIEAVIMGTGTEFLICLDPSESPDILENSDNTVIDYTQLYQDSDIKDWAASIIGCKASDVEIVEED